LVALALLTFLLSYFFVPIFSDLMVKFTFSALLLFLKK